MIKRYLNIDLPKGKSAFLWGARKTGKSTYLKTNFPNSIYFDLLKSDLFFELNIHPERLREQLLNKKNQAIQNPVIIDEVQKVPAILDEIHWLIENTGMQFILCGSSARKLIKTNANLLGGRAWRYLMLPFIYPELDNPDLLRILNHGLLPSHYLEDNYKKSLISYTRDYMQEEVFNEGLTRNLPAFFRFFEAIGYSNGELINYSKLASDTGVSSKTIKEYFQILIDTLIGHYVLPFNKRAGRDILSKTPKFYLFDVGIAGILLNRKLEEEKGEMFGKAFEHYIFMELFAYHSYNDVLSPIYFWRTKYGYEVDFVLGNGSIAIEVKGSQNIRNNELKSLKEFINDYDPKKAIVVCNEKNPRTVNNIEILPWKIFLEKLWGGEII